MGDSSLLQHAQLVICTVSSGSQKLDSAKMSYPISLFLANEIAQFTLLSYGDIITQDLKQKVIRHSTLKCDKRRASENLKMLTPAICYKIYISHNLTLLF